KIGAPVPDVGPPPPNPPPPPGADPRMRFPGKNARPAPQGENPNKSKPDEKPKPEEKDKDKSVGNPEDRELAASEREYLWQIEHHGNVLTKFGFAPLADALKRADAAALSRLLADDFAGADLDRPQRVDVATGFAAVERLQSSGVPPRRLTKAEFVA